MTAPLAVIDTNVVVSGLLTGWPDSPTVRILDGMLVGRFAFLVSPELLEEYRAVLLRPRIQERHRLGEREIETVLTEVVANARFREIAPAASGGVRNDEHLWVLLALEPESVLVTGDRPLAASPRGSGRVLSPREFAARLI
ncbi:MAG: PIN domain-containing protein [Acidobacteriota bacterium]